MTVRITERHGLTLVLLDEIADLSAEHRGKVVVTGSHGGLVSGRRAIRYPPQLTVFNDAGVGKDRAGIAALEMLDSFRLPALAVAAVSARIGDAEDALQGGIVSHLNASAVALGLVADVPLDEALMRLATSTSRPDALRG
jgi:hypothetical protein